MNENVNLVIVTRGHRRCLTVPAQAGRTDACCTGIIGGSRKRRAVYQSLRERGISEERHSPVGLKAGAQTPEEIAARLIRIRGELLSG